MTRPLGYDAGPRYGDAMRDVIGELERTPSGNIAVRIGQELPAGGWTQTGYVVLTRDEAHELSARIAELLAIRAVG